ncbi:MAG: putative cathepsin B2 cysteine protease, partial [Streblomastix strix]
MFVLILITNGLTQSIPEIINSNPNSTWVAVDYPPSIMNKMKHNSQISNHITSHETEPYKDNSNVPSEFDARKQWPGLILGVRDQGDCGACWAFSIAENIGNRLGILKCSRGFMSPQDLISCNDFGSGCKGGY